MKTRPSRILCLLATGAASVLVLAGCVPSAPPTAEQVAAEFEQEIAPAWTADIPGIYGEATIVDDVVAVYARDDADGMRLEVRDTKTGDLLWQHVASPGGAWGSPLFAETDSVSRLNPVPTIRPFVVTRGEGDEATPVILFTERVITETDAFLNPDILHLAELRTGDELTLSAPDYVEFETPFGEAETDDDGSVLVSAYSPFRVCGTGPKICTEDSNGGYYVIDAGALEVTNTKPEWDPTAVQRSREWGPGFVNDLDAGDGGVTVSRLEDGEVLWSTGVADLFGVPGTRPAEDTDFIRLGDVVLIQGYQAITELAGLTPTLEYDYATSRTLVAVERDTGEVLWRVPGGDALCFAVDGFPIGPKPDVIPVCHATEGSYSYSGDGSSLLDSVDPAVSIAGLSLEDGSLRWEVPHAGDQSVLDHGRQIEAVFASGTTFAVVDASGAENGSPGVVDLATGRFAAVPDSAGFLCEAEHAGVKLEFQGSSFASGANPIAIEFPAGWYQFACNADATPAKTWTKGSVRAGGLAAPDGRVIVVTEKGLAGFAL